MITMKLAPRYFQFFVSDASLPENPVQGEPIEIISNGKCLSVPCAYWGEAETELTVGSSDELDMADKPQFDGMLPAPGSLVFTDAELNELLSWPVSAAETRIRIWTDGLMLPDRIIVAVG